jgi:hypothetical protein
MPQMVLKANALPRPLIGTILRAVEPFSGARAAAEKAIADAASAPDQTSDVHPDEVENWTKQGWQVAPDAKTK